MNLFTNSHPKCDCKIGSIDIGDNGTGEGMTGC